MLQYSEGQQHRRLQKTYCRAGTFFQPCAASMHGVACLFDVMYDGHDCMMKQEQCWSLLLSKSAGAIRTSGLRTVVLSKTSGVTCRARTLNLVFGGSNAFCSEHALSMPQLFVPVGSQHAAAHLLVSSDCAA